MSKSFYELGPFSKVAEPSDCSRLKPFLFTVKDLVITYTATVIFQLWLDHGQRIELTYGVNGGGASGMRPSPAPAQGVYSVRRAIMCVYVGTGNASNSLLGAEMTVDGAEHYVKFRGTFGEYGTCYEIVAESSVSVTKIHGAITGCLVAGTMVRLASGGVKRIEDVSYDDELAVWDGVGFAAARPAWIMRPWRATHWFECRFRSGRTLCTTGADGDPGHRVLDMSTGRYEYERDAIGHRVRTLKATERVGGPTVFGAAEDTLESVTCVPGPCWAYNIITEGHYNMVAEDVVTSCRLSNPGMSSEEVAAYWERLERMRKPRKEA